MKRNNNKMTMRKIQNYDFDLPAGQFVKIKATGNTMHTFPPWDGRTYIAEIKHEHPFTFSGMVYPHKLYEKHNYSNAYRISINKVDIIFNNVKVTKVHG